MLTKNKNIACEFVDESCGSAKALRDVWISHVRKVDNIHVINLVAHSLPTLFGFSPTKFTRLAVAIFLFLFFGAQVARPQTARLRAYLFCNSFVEAC
jgi:hypothetical protein